MGFALRLALAFGLSATLALQASPSLKTAASQGNLEAIKMNLAEGKNINEPDSNGWTPLMWAINNRQIAAADLLLNHGADPNLQATDSCKSYQKGATAMILAAADGQQDVIQALCEKKAILDQGDAFGWTPLMWATFYRQFSAVNFLLLMGANPNVKSSGPRDFGSIDATHFPEGTTPLLLAAWNCNEDIVSSLLYRKADKNLADSAGLTPGRIARRNACGGVLAVLGMQPATTKELNLILWRLEDEINLDQPCFEGWTALMWSVHYRDLSTTEYLLKKGADPNVKSTSSNKSFPKGVTALSMAASDSMEEPVRWLLEKGARISEADTQGNTPIDYARKGKLNDNLYLLRTPINPASQALLDRVKKEKNPDTLDSIGWTPLMHAIAEGDRFTAESLLDLGANPIIQSTGERKPYPAGITALMLASDLGQETTVNAILKKHSETSLKDSRGNTAADYARRSQQTGVLGLMKSPFNKHLLEMLAEARSGRNVNLPTENGWTPLMWAAFYGDIYSVQSLLEQGANPNIQSRKLFKDPTRRVHPKGVTALAIACNFWEDPSIVSTLTQKGADCHIKDETGKTARDYAEASGLSSIANVLFNRAPIEGNYTDLFVEKISAPREIARDYPWVVEDCEKAVLRHLKQSERIAVHEAASKNSAPVPGSLTLQVEFTELRIPSWGARQFLRWWAGDSYIWTTLKLIERETGQVRREEQLHFVNSRWLLDTAGTNEPTFSSAVGKLLADYVAIALRQAPGTTSPGMVLH